jgi:uncharacterized protein involved in exopolysaccharide biosynthesis
MNSTPEYWDSRGQVDLAELMRQIWRGRVWVLVSTVICTAAFLMLGKLMAPIYRAQTVLAPAALDAQGMSGSLGSLGSLGGLAALAGVNLGGNAGAAEEALAVLRSREFTEKFLREKELLPKLYPDIWDAKAKQWTVPAARQPSYARAFAYFDTKVREIESDKLTGLVTVKIEWRSAVEAAEWANDLIARLNAEMRARAMRDSNAAIGYLEKELATTSTVETRLAIGRLVENQINQRMLASVTQEYAFRVVDRALPADIRDRVRPKMSLLAALGVMFGLVVGAVIALIHDGIKRRRTAPAS